MDFRTRQELRSLEYLLFLGGPQAASSLTGDSASSIYAALYRILILSRYNAGVPLPQPRTPYVPRMRTNARCGQFRFKP